MSSSPSFRPLLVLATLVLSAGIVGAVTIDGADTPDDAEVDERIEAEYALTDLYQDYDEWTLQTSTELRNVTWSYRLVDLSGDPVDTASADGQNASVDVAEADGVAEVEVRVVGEVPAIENFTYDPAPTFVVAELEQSREGGTSETIGTYEARHYTAESNEARDAIESARQAIEAAGGNVEAEETLGNAVSAYEGENFENAVNLAEQAERHANQAQQSQQRNQLLLYGGIALVLILVVIGVVYWFLNRDTASRL